MSQQIDVTVAALIEDRGRFLLVEEQAGGGLVFNQPAGHLEPGETLTSAVIRETLEETGYRFKPDSLLGIYVWHCIEASTTFLRVAFCGDAAAPAGNPSLDEGIVATHWLTPAQVLARETQLRSPMVRRCIDDYLDGTRHPLSVVSNLPPEQLLSLARA